MPIWSKTSHRNAAQDYDIKLSVEIKSILDGFGGLVVSMLASGTRVCGLDFSGI
jgi:hypothetical protein